MVVVVGIGPIVLVEWAFVAAAVLECPDGVAAGAVGRKAQQCRSQSVWVKNWHSEACSVQNYVVESVAYLAA